MEHERIHTFITPLNQKFGMKISVNNKTKVNGFLTNIVLLYIENEILFNAVQLYLTSIANEQSYLGILLFGNSTYNLACLQFYI